MTRSLRGCARAGLAGILRSAHDALRDGAPSLALRNLDRAWRAFPDESAFIAPLYARALMLDGGDYEAALSIAQSAIASAPDPDIAATRVMASLQLGRSAEALQHLEAALVDYCVIPGEALARAADEVVRHPSVEAPGWIGLGPTLAVMSRLTQPDAGKGLEVREVEGRRFASHRGVRLLGSGAPRPAFLLDGRATNSGRRIAAWARLGWRPGAAPRLRMTDHRERTVEVQSDGPPRPGWRWPYTLPLDSARLRGDCLQVAAQLPDGTWCALPDAPLLLKTRVPNLPRARRPPASRATQRRHIDVIIPVYGNRAASLACIESALSTTGGLARVVVVDDASEDRLLQGALDALARDARILLLRNPENLGFAGAVNRGLALDSSRDGVLLNSDTVVFGDWLMRMQAAAYSDPAVGSVTPLSNNGSIASYPDASGNSALSLADAAALHALAASSNAGRRVEIPVGVGFCLFLRRDCLNDVGTLDAAVFGAGYGEETDFCLRAKRQGWTHCLSADVYVSHAGALSFGTRRAALLDRSQRLLNLRHPGYDRSILSYLARNPAHPVRRTLDEQRLRAHAGRHVLIVTLALTGGVDRFVKQRCRELRALGVTALLLRPAKPHDSAVCELYADGLDMPNLQYAIPTELAALQELLRSIAFDSIEIQHFLHLDARLIDAVRALPVRYDVFIHDYAWLCPRVTLIDGSGRYCGEPAVKVCETCVTRHGSNLGEALSVMQLRRRSATWLRGARRVVAPSQDTATRIERHFPGLDVEVRPHAAPPPAPLPAPTILRARQRPLRVVLIGAIGAHKGYDVLLSCARDARARRLPIEYVVIGYTENDAPLLATGKVFITGPYIDGEAPHLIAREQPDVAWLPSVWPETWCYTLDYALGARLPVVAFDLGAIAERLRGAHGALLLPLAMKSQRINDRLLDFVDGASVSANAATNSVKSLPAPVHGMASIDKVQLRGNSMVKSANGKASMEAPEAGLSASLQMLPLAAGLYLFSVKAGKPHVATNSGQMALPAIHVGVGPGVRSDQVEFLSSASTHGAWLFSAADQLVARVHGTSATLILTSVRAPTGDLLSIKVERLDARLEAVEPAATAVTPPVKIAPPVKSADAPLSVQVAAHVRVQGDMKFVDSAWAGRVAPGLWIESFAVLPLEHLGAHDIEYKGLTGSGFETPWLSDNTACGTKGMGVPLVGFALRLRPGTVTAAYDCEYCGYFQSGLTVGPLRNGAPCRSSVANDPLEGIQVRVVKRRAATSTFTPAIPASKSATGADPRRMAAKSKVPGIATVKPGKRVALAR